AGPRVIRETIGQDLPDGFQTSEYLRDHGLVDEIVPRPELKGALTRILRMLTGRPAAPPREQVEVTHPGSKAAAQPLVKPESPDLPE
ncbi:MAG: acetyl-CoA carboxylase carboxyl transferase subunit beta, partial [Myxococcota bacterium]